MLSITAEDILPQRVNRSRAIWLFVSVFAVTLFALHQIYSHSGTPVFDIWATNAVISNLAVANGPPSMHLHSEHQLAFESQESSLHQLGNTSAGVPPMEKTEENLKFGLTIGTVEQYQPALEKKQVLPESSPPNVGRSPELLNGIMLPQPIRQSNQVKVFAMPKFHILSSDSCPPLHIVMIIVSYSESRSSFLAIKSILMYRQEKLHFHFITDSTAQKILGTMMSSWLLPGVEFDFYNITEAWSTTPWSNSQLCSKELLKIAALHLVLPHEIDAVLVVDPNLIITTSVFEMFYQTLVDLGQKGRLIALSSSECTIECNNSSVMQRNTTNISHSTLGVMVLNLAGMRSSVSWRNVWEAIRSEPPDCKQASSVTSLDTVRDMYATLRCDWNTYEYLPSSALEHCWAKISTFQQWSKSNTLREILQRIQEYDGYQLRFKEQENCYHGNPKLKRPPSSAYRRDKCVMLKWQGAARRRMYPYILGCKYTSSDPNDVTLVGHLTPDRLYLAERASIHWNGPMSLAIHVIDAQVQQVIDFVSKSELLSQRKNIAYHLLFKLGPSYPENPMRNLGHKFVTTPYVFFNDIDFVPSYGLYENLKDIISNIDDMQKTALVVPCFDTSQPKMNYPSNKQEMVNLMQKHLVSQSHVAFWRRGHAPTNYNKWAQNTTTSPYTVTWKQFYEPYIAVKTSVLPFDPRFVARNNDKASHIEELHMAGYRFMVVHNGFIIHMPHPHSKGVWYPYYCYQRRYHKWQQEKRRQYRSH